MFNFRKDMEELLKKYPDPRNAFGIAEFNRRQESRACLPRYGVVADNRDPARLGRIRVACDMIAPGAVTSWIPIMRPYASADSGWWYLPDIGTQVLIGFVGDTLNNPFVFGCVYDRKHLPPKHSTEHPADSILIQTKAHRLEMIDEEGKEAIIISSAKGKIRLCLSNEKGIEYVNELGD